MDERLWTDAPLSEIETLLVGGARVTLKPPAPTAYLVSGRLPIALKVLKPDTPILGLLEDCSGMQNFAISISRDSALLVTREPLAQQQGWNDIGFGVSQASDLPLLT